MKYILIGLALLVSACKTSIPLDPPPSLSPSPTASPAPAKAGIKGAWNNEAWDKILRAELVADKMDEVASIKDAKDFCPNYSKLSKSQRLDFWHVFMIAMAKRESGYKAETTYKESFKDNSGKNVISAGLFQLSQESGRSRSYRCGQVTTELLQTPKVGIMCAVHILSKWVKQDGYAAGIEGHNFGAARYWSVGRMGSSRDYIKSQAVKAPGCS